MIHYIIKKLLVFPVTLFFLMTLTFFLVRLTPGGPFDSERSLDPVVEEAMKEKYHLNAPLPQQYLHYLGNCLKLDLGPSFKHKATSVNEIIAATFPNSMLLGSLSLLLALAIGMAAGIIAASRHNTFIDYWAMTLSVLGLSLPAFVLAPLFQLFFAMKWSLLPVAGYNGLASPAYLILPALTLSLPFAARIARLTRGGMLEVLNQDFIRTAKAKGLKERTMICRHALKGGLMPVITFLGPAFAALMTGSLVIERVFKIPGLGQEFVEAALNRDYTLVSGTVLVYGSLLIICNLISDLVCAWVDPRVRF
ncbi:MAG: ABC transporter permease [Planctomycetes bacterium]|nr:ABC transporter permease [Planctomycetota bacterium]